MRRAETVYLSDLLDRILDTGIVVRGQILITVAEIELLYLDVAVLVSSVSAAFGSDARRLP